MPAERQPTRGLDAHTHLLHRLARYTDLAERKQRDMITLVVAIVVTWAGLLVAIVAMLHAATSGATPQPASNTPLTSIGQDAGATRRTAPAQTLPGPTSRPAQAA